ncbi:MAG TPA: serine/threonine-protein kinase [Gemmataceae bacterium]|nr:serine/threonine-protein kinase [Gemmataceae bacterium]
MTADRCPTHEELSAFAVGKLPGNALDQISEHTAGCDHCASTLDALADNTDPLLRELRQPVEGHAADEAEVQRVVALVERIGASTGSPEAERTPSPGEPATATFVPEPEFGRLGQYELLEKLGDGGMGQVYKARHALMDRIVAVKVIHKQHLANPENVRRFQREIRALSQLNHPNIVRAEYADQAGDTHFLVMEYVEGVNLHRLVKERGPLPVAEACAYIQQAAAGLAHAHERGLVHRDIKPSNLIVSSGQWAVGSKEAVGSLPTAHCPLPTVKILDLGLALLRDDHPGAGELTTPGQVLGTLDYMAPEQWDATHRVDHRADLYSLGCTLYYLLAGQPPFGGPEYQSTRQKMKAHLTMPPPPIRERRRDAPEELAAVLERMLAKEPSQRYQSAKESIDSLQPFVQPTSGDSAPPKEAAIRELTPPARRERSLRQYRRWRRVGARLLAASLALLALVAIAVQPSLFQRASPDHDRSAGPGPVAQAPIEDKQLPNAPLASPLRASLRVYHFRGDPAVPLGEMGKSSFTARLNDDIRFRVDYRERAYSYLIAFNPDGKEQFCCSDKPTAATSTAFEYPGVSYFGLTDAIGLQAVVLLGFRTALPPYEEWKARIGAAPWRAFQAEGIWQFDGQVTKELIPQERGAPRERRGLRECMALFATTPEAGLAGLSWFGLHWNSPRGPPPPLVELCNFLKERSGADAIQVLAFPVKAK